MLRAGIALAIHPILRFVTDRNAPFWGAFQRITRPCRESPADTASHDIYGAGLPITGSSAATDVVCAGGLVVWLNGTGAEIVGTAQKHAERLQRSRTRACAERVTWEQRFREAFFVSPAPISLSTLADGVFLDVNPSFLELTGYCRDEVVGRSVADLHFWYEPAEREKMLRMLEHSDGPARYAELRLRTKAGSIRQMVVSVDSFILDDEPCLLAIYRDVTAEKEVERDQNRVQAELADTIRSQSEQLDQVNRKLQQECRVRRRAEDRCWESQRMLATLMNHLPGIVYRRRNDDDWTMEYISAGCRSLLGQFPQDLIGNRSGRFADHVHPEDRLLACEAVQKAIEARQPFRLTYRIQHVEGSLRWVCDRGKGAYDVDGNPVALEGLIVDITDERLAQEALQRSEQRRAEAEKLALAGDLAARVAHEINNPLAGIQNAFHVVKAAVPADHPAQQFVGPIEREIARIAGIVRRMIELNRSEREAPVPVNVKTAIDDVFAMVSGLAGNHGVSLKRRVLGDPRRPMLPEGMFRQILYNLIVNAIEASPPGELVRVDAAVADDQLELVVTDRGPGISPEIETRLFEPFCTTKARKATGGLGLGLAITRGIVTALRGTIRFESMSSGGTAFIVNLPLQTAGKE